MAEPVPVDVWWADLTQADLALARALPAAERGRVMATERHADRGRRLVAAALLQHAVAASRRGDGRGDGPIDEPVDGPGDRPVDGPVDGPVEIDEPVEVDRTCEECGAQHGRPVVHGGPHLSVSHAGVLVVVATCATARIGIDLERVARFAGSEEEALAWTRSEAAVKAGGVGTGGREGLTTLEPPFPGYVATLCVATLCVASQTAAGTTTAVPVPVTTPVTVTEHRVTL